MRAGMSFDQNFLPLGEPSWEEIELLDLQLKVDDLFIFNLIIASKSIGCGYKKWRTFQTYILAFLEAQVKMKEK